VCVCDGGWLHQPHLRSKSGLIRVWGLAEAAAQLWWHWPITAHGGEPAEHDTTMNWSDNISLVHVLVGAGKPTATPLEITTRFVVDYVFVKSHTKTLNNCCYGDLRRAGVMYDGMKQRWAHISWAAAALIKPLFPARVRECGNVFHRKLFPNLSDPEHVLLMLDFTIGKGPLRRGKP